MFGLSKKERIVEALRRGVTAATIGGFFHVKDAESFGLNKEASSWIFTESIAHQVTALATIYSATLVGKEYWATSLFFKMTVHKILTTLAQSAGLAPNAYYFVISRMQKFSDLSPDQLAAGEHYMMSAIEARKLDPEAIIEKISTALRKSTETYFAVAVKMFA